MAFRLERQMSAPAEAWLKAQDLATKSEFQTPWGICDLVGCALNRRHVHKRLRLRQRKPIGPLLRVAILSQIAERGDGDPTAFRRLCDQYAGLIDETQLRAELGRLCRDGFVEITPRGAFHRLNGWTPLHRLIVAVELKLARPGDALAQARANQEFADQSYVGLPAELARGLSRTRRRKDFTELGIGLVAVSLEGCRVLIKPSRQRSLTNRVMQAHCAERFWPDWIRGSSA